jgi:hypothetical protein
VSVRLIISQKGSAIPPKKPAEMYPEDGPPPRISIIKVTIQPVRWISDKIEIDPNAMVIISERTSDGYLHPNIHKNKKGKEVDCFQLHYLFKFVVVTSALLSRTLAYLS